MSSTNQQIQTTSGNTTNPPTSPTNPPTKVTNNLQINPNTQKNKRTLIDRVTGKNKNIPPPKNILPYTNEYEILKLYDETEKSIKEKMMISIKSIFTNILPQFLENSMHKFNKVMEQYTKTEGIAGTAEPTKAGTESKQTNVEPTAEPTPAGTTTSATPATSATAEPTPAGTANKAKLTESQAGGKKKTRRKLRKLRKQTLKRKKNSRTKK